jgi:4-alpha-glucanotransferase
MKRSSGILLPIAALPSPYGIGTLGRAAYDFIDFLADAGQRWWQVLPVGPTGWGDSPYQSASSFAGNPYFLDLDALAADGLLRAEELRTQTAAPGRVDYGALWRTRPALLARAADRALAANAAAVERFAAENPWLPDYARFTALKRRLEQRPWRAWPEDIRLRRRAALARCDERLAEKIRREEAVQYLFAVQWDALRRYAAERGVGIIGDLPFYAAPDAADVWAEPQFFRLDAHGAPGCVAGVPPDYFSADGQLWGNPLYDWEAMRRDGYGWWIRRIGCAASRFDAVRIDHFRGFESYWAVPAEAETAKDGHWEKGPGMALIGVLRDWFPNLQFLAEDLGAPSEAVERLLAESGWPGMTVLQFAFDAGGQSRYLPHACVRNSVCYTGTHDNTTLADWPRTARRRDVNFAKRYLGVASSAELRTAILRAGLGSVSELFVAQMQDWLGLGAAARTNTPGTLGGNWQWRLRPGELTDGLAKQIAALTALYGRS